MNRQDLIQALNRVKLVAERDAPVRMIFEQDHMYLHAGSDNSASATEMLDIAYSGEPIKLSFNPAYLKDGLTAMTREWVHLSIRSNTTTVEFNEQDEREGTPSRDFRYLLVPMRDVSSY